MGFLNDRAAHVRDLTLIKNFGRPDESRRPIRGVVQAKQGFFELTTPIHERDVIELPDPRGESRQLTVGRVLIHERTGADHIEVRWGPVPQVREAPVRRLGLERLHSRVLSVSGALYTDGHYAQAILEAFKAVEVRVREMSGLDASGADLMGKAFGAHPRIRVAGGKSQSERDEQEGFKLLCMGAIRGIRNPKSHEIVNQDDPQRALEYLAFASLLMRRLDDAERLARG